MVGPILLLTVLCATMAVLPSFGLNLLDGALLQILGSRTAAEIEALVVPGESVVPVGTANAWLLGAIGVTGLLLAALTRKSIDAQGATWGCGFNQPSVRMQYTGRSFAQLLADHLLPRFLRPRATIKRPAGLFPAQGEFTGRSPDPFTERGYEPFFAHWARGFAWLRILQQGQVNSYLTYIVMTVVLMLAWLSLRAWWMESV